MGNFELNSVNWQDGMLISMSHFRDQNRYFEELSRWHAAKINDNYGLVKKTPDQPALKYSASISGNLLKVEVSRCRAVLPCGMFVEFNETVSGGGVLKAEAEVKETSMPVFLGVALGDKTQVGDPDPSEEIPRIPYEMPNYFLSLIEPPNLPESGYLKIAALTVNGSQVSHAGDYFPPCVSFSDDDNLSAKAVDYRNRMENLLKLSTRAYMAVSSRGLEGASTKLQNSLKETMDYLKHHIASNIDDFVVGRNAGHPQGLIINLKKLFRVVSSLLNTRPLLKDYLNEKFFNKENTDVKTYLLSVDAFLMSEYNHRDIGKQIRMLDEILMPLGDMMAFLAQTSPDKLQDQEEMSETKTYRGKTYKISNIGGSRLENVGEFSYLVMDPEEKGPVSDALIIINRSLFTDDEWRSMQVRLGFNEARVLGETDPVDIDLNTYRNKAVLHPLDMLKSSSVEQVTLIFRGVSVAEKLNNLGKSDLTMYILS